MRLGGDVGRRVDGHVMSVRFRHGNDFGDENIRLLTPFTKLEMLNLQGTQIAGTRIGVGSGLNELNQFQDFEYATTSETRAVGDSGIEQLAGLKRLTRLDLMGTDITDASMRVTIRREFYADSGRDFDQVPLESTPSSNASFWPTGQS